MRGFVINIRKAKNEDVIVTVLSSKSVKKYWRFYGVRHAILQIGNLIEFEVKESKKGFMPNMRSLSQHSFPWLFTPERLIIWQSFIKLFEVHFKERIEIEPFYFNLLLESAKKWEKQNPKRLAVEAYVHLLKHENRLRSSNLCYICENELNDTIGLIRAFTPIHLHCVPSAPLNREEVLKLLNSGSTIHLNDTTVNTLYQILLKGL